MPEAGSKLGQLAQALRGYVMEQNQRKIWQDHSRGNEGHLRRQRIWVEGSIVRHDVDVQVKEPTVSSRLRSNALGRIGHSMSVFIVVIIRASRSSFADALFVVPA